MKHRSIWKIPVLAVLLVLSGWSWVLAQTQEFSADQILLAPGGEQQGKVNFGKDRWRVEVTSQDRTMIQIFRMDRRSSGC